MTPKWTPEDLSPHIQTDIQPDRHIDTQTDRQTDLAALARDDPVVDAGRLVAAQTDRQTHRQIHRRTDRQRDTKTDRLTLQPSHVMTP